MNNKHYIGSELYWSIRDLLRNHVHKNKPCETCKKIKNIEKQIKKLYEERVEE